MDKMSDFQARVDEVVRSTTFELTSAKQRGALMNIPTFDNLFGRLIKSLNGDPRWSPADKETAKSITTEAYRKLSQGEGYSGSAVEPSLMRGLCVHIVVRVKDGVILNVEPYADERYAVALMNEWLRDNGCQRTVADIRANPDIDLGGLKGSRVLSCPIR